MKSFWLKIPFLYDLIQVLLTGGFLNKLMDEVQIPKNKRILELGCGTGTLSQKLNCLTYVGVDLNKDFVRFAKVKFPRHTFKVLDIVTDKLPQDRFDYVLIMNVLHHLNDKQLDQLFKKISKLKKDRRFVIIEGRPVGLLAPILKRLDDGNNFREFPQLIELMSPYFKIQKTTQISSGNRIYRYLISEIKIHG